LQKGRGETHLLHSFCVMPNHVHLVLTPSRTPL
jgi:REP element-mobilizing transposase RayT